MNDTEMAGPALKAPPPTGPAASDDAAVGPLFMFHHLTGEGPFKLRGVDWYAVSRGWEL